MTTQKYNNKNYGISSGSGKIHRKTLLLKDIQQEESTFKWNSNAWESININFWVVGTWNQPFIRGS